MGTSRWTLLYYTILYYITYFLYECNRLTISLNRLVLIYLVLMVVIVPKCFLINNDNTASTSDVLNIVCHGLLPPDLFDTYNYILNTLMSLYP